MGNDSVTEGSVCFLSDAVCERASSQYSVDAVSIAEVCVIGQFFYDTIGSCLKHIEIKLPT